DVALTELLALAHVEQDGLLPVREARLRLVGRHLGHLLPRFRHHLLVGLGHSSTLDTVKEIHSILEPARHAAGVSWRDEEPGDAEPAPERIATRQAKRIGAEPEEEPDFLPVDPPEQAASPERPDDHRPSAACASASR